MSELNEQAVEVAARTIFASDGVMMGEMSVAIPGGYPNWDDARVSETMRDEYRAQAREVVTAYVENEDLRMSILKEVVTLQLFAIRAARFTTAQEVVWMLEGMLETGEDEK